MSMNIAWILQPGSSYSNFTPKKGVGLPRTLDSFYKRKFLGRDVRPFAPPFAVKDERI